MRGLLLHLGLIFLVLVVSAATLAPDAATTTPCLAYPACGEEGLPRDRTATPAPAIMLTTPPAMPGAAAVHGPAAGPGVLAGPDGLIAPAALVGAQVVRWSTNMRPSVEGAGGGLGDSTTLMAVAGAPFVLAALGLLVWQLQLVRTMQLWLAQRRWRRLRRKRRTDEIRRVPRAALRTLPQRRPAARPATRTDLAPKRRRKVKVKVKGAGKTTGKVSGADFCRQPRVSA